MHLSIKERLAKEVSRSREIMLIGQEDLSIDDRGKEYFISICQLHRETLRRIYKELIGEEPK